MKLVSIVILNWNGKQHLELFLPALIRHTTHPDAEIVVADNGSVDDSLEFLKNEYPRIRIIEDITVQWNRSMPDTYSY